MLFAGLLDNAPGLSETNLRRLTRLVTDLCENHLATDVTQSGYSEILFFAQNGRYSEALKSADHMSSFDCHFLASLLIGAILAAHLTQGNESKEIFIASQELLVSACKIRPEDSRPYYWMGVLIKPLKPEVATTCFKKAIYRNPDDAHSRIEYSRLLVFNQSKIDEGLAEFDRALKIDPHYIEAYSETNFYELYLQGATSPKLKEHTDSFPARRRQIAHDWQLDQFPIKLLAGIAPFIGHYGYLDTFIKLQKLGWLPAQQQIAILARPQEIVNPNLMSYFSKHIPVYSNPVPFDLLSRISRLIEFDYQTIPGFTTAYQNDLWRMSVAVQEEWEKRNLPPALSISAEHKDRARAALTAVGMPKDAWFVALHVRDDGFKGPNNEHALRNANVADYCEAAREITSRGGWVIRMGDAKMVPFPEIPMVFDYARSNIKSDWMDVFFWAECKFFIGGNSGPSWIPHCFGVPVVRVNWTPITRAPWTSADLMICKRFEERKTSRKLTFREMIDPAGPISWAHDSGAISSRGLRCQDNTPEEIHTAVVEMFDKLNGADYQNDHTRNLQSRLDQMILQVSSGHDQGDRATQFSPGFLKKFDFLVD